MGNPAAGMDPITESLASLGEYPKKRGAAGGDGTEPIPPKARTPDDAAEATGSAIAPMRPTIADVSPIVRFNTIDMLARSQDRLAKNRWNIDQAHDWTYRGIPFGRLEKIPNQSLWVSKLPNGMTKESPAATPNKARDLVDKVTDSLMADPPKLVATPPSNDMQAEEAAEFATEFLSEDGGASGTDDTGTYRWALLTALIRSSSFLHYTVDPTGGGYQPMQVLAHPQAQDPADPLVAQIPTGQVGPDGQPLTMPERSVNPILRYVSAPTEGAPDGQFVDDAIDADRVWLPKNTIKRMRREQVRVFPYYKRAEDAAAIILLDWCTLSDGIKEWPDTVGQMGLTELQNLASGRVALSEQYLIPFAFWGMADGQTGPTPDEVGILAPILTRRMYFYRLYVAPCTDYPKGYWCASSSMAGGTDLGSGDLEYEVELPVHGTVKRCRDLPVVQVTPMLDATDGDPMGWAFISRLSGGAEAEATLWAAALDRIDNELHPHVIIPSTTPIDEDDWNDRTVPIITSPDATDPHYEQFPPFPPVVDMLDRVDKKLDVVSGLSETAQALDTDSSSSGIAKSLTIQQAKVYLSQFQQEMHRATTRGGKIKCQNTQAFFTVPQLVKYSGEEGSAGPIWWTGKNMGGIDNLRIQPGTGTLMTPEGKAQYTGFLQGQQWITPEDAADIALPGARTLLGLPESPIEQALEREIGVWMQGPSEEWKASYAQQKGQYDQSVQQAQASIQQQTQQAQVTGMQPPMPPQIPPFQPNLPSPFVPRANDQEPRVAKAIAKRLSNLMFDPQYAAQPPEWRSLVDQKYTAAVQALTPPAPMPMPAPGHAAPLPAPVTSPIQGPQAKAAAPGASPTSPMHAGMA